MTVKRAPIGLAVVLSAVLSAAACGGEGATSPETEAGPSSAPATPTDVVVLSEWTENLLPAGRYAMAANGLPDTPWAVVAVPGPGDFSNLEGWTIFHEQGEDATALGYWTVSGVDRDPCEAASPLLEVGTTVDDLVAAFERQRRTRVSQPDPVTLDGYDGVTFTLRMPPGTVPGECPDDGYELWVSDPGGGRSIGEPARYDRLWILDVEGQVLVLQAGLDAHEGPPDPDAVLRMVKSVEFVPRSM